MVKELVLIKLLNKMKEWKTIYKKFRKCKKKCSICIYMNKMNKIDLSYIKCLKVTDDSADIELKSEI